MIPPWWISLTSDLKKRWQRPVLTQVVTGNCRSCAEHNRGGTQLFVNRVITVDCLFEKRKWGKEMNGWGKKRERVKAVKWRSKEEYKGKVQDRWCNTAGEEGNKGWKLLRASELQCKGHKSDRCINHEDRGGKRGRERAVAKQSTIRSKFKLATGPLMDENADLEALVSQEVSCVCGGNQLLNLHLWIIRKICFTCVWLHWWRKERLAGGKN